MYNRNDQIFVRINRSGFIHQLGICGPIPNPIKVSCGKCLDMINSGIDVFQVDPNTRDMVKLTLENIFDDKKFSKKESVKTPVTPVKPVVIPESKPLVFTGVQKDAEKPIEKTEDVVQKEEPVAPVVEPETIEDTEETVSDADVSSNDTDEVKSSTNNGFKNKNKKFK